MWSLFIGHRVLGVTVFIGVVAVLRHMSTIERRPHPA